MSDFAPGDTPFTGRKMLLIILAFFGTIIAVNATMLTLAIKNFGGLVVENSYVASQRFNTDLASSLAEPIRQWKIEPRGDASRITISIAAPGGDPVSGVDLSVLAARPTHDRENQMITLQEQQPGAYASNVGLAPGVWYLTLMTTDGQQRTLDLFIK